MQIAPLSSSCKLIWKHWTSKIQVKYMMPGVCLRLRWLSQLSFMQYMGLCVFILPSSLLFRVRPWGTRRLSYYVFICHCLGWNWWLCTMCQQCKKTLWRLCNEMILQENPLCIHTLWLFLFVIFVHWVYLFYTSNFYRYAYKSYERFPFNVSLGSIDFK